MAMFNTFSQLLLDKKVLTSRCNQLNLELKHQKSENEDNFLNFEDRLAIRSPLSVFKLIALF